jgi:hypothetical protein
MEPAHWCTETKPTLYGSSLQISKHGGKKAYLDSAFPTGAEDTYMHTLQSRT